MFNKMKHNHKIIIIISVIILLVIGVVIWGFASNWRFINNSSDNEILNKSGNIGDESIEDTEVIVRDDRNTGNTEVIVRDDRNIGNTEVIVRDDTKIIKTEVTSVIDDRNIGNTEVIVRDDTKIIKTEVTSVIDDRNTKKSAGAKCNIMNDCESGVCKNILLYWIWYW